MEDRLPTGLYLELVRDDDADQRAASLVAAGLAVSTWSPDPYPPGIPRTIEDCARLLVGETAAADPGAAYAALPSSDATSTVVPLRRYPRPSQGLCTGERTTGLLLVLITPRSIERAQELRDWADFVHLRHIAAARVPGYTTITPYEHVAGAGAGACPRFCHLYEMVTPDPRAAYTAMTPAVAGLLGGQGTPEFAQWARHPALRIDYVNTFRRD